ncbi:MAG: hypothetical protein AAFU79_16925, partial [Myxococcota bacterium]
MVAVVETDRVEASSAESSAGEAPKPIAASVSEPTSTPQEAPQDSRSAQHDAEEDSDARGDVEAGRESHSATAEPEPGGETAETSELEADGTSAAEAVVALEAEVDRTAAEAELKASGADDASPQETAEASEPEAQGRSEEVETSKPEAKERSTADGTQTPRPAQDGEAATEVSDETASAAPSASAGLSPEVELSPDPSAVARAELDSADVFITDAEEDEPLLAAEDGSTSPSASGDEPILAADDDGSLGEVEGLRLEVASGEPVGDDEQELLPASVGPSSGRSSEDAEATGNFDDLPAPRSQAPDAHFDTPDSGIEAALAERHFTPRPVRGGAEDDEEEFTPETLAGPISLEPTLAGEPIPAPLARDAAV